VALAQLAAQSPIAGIVITNENHIRATTDFAGQFPVPVYFHLELLDRVSLPSVQPIQDAGSFAPGLTAITIEGAVAGEIALYSDADGGALVVGDALINFEPYGFTFLPAKYCSNPKAMRRSLTQLLDYSFERILFAHGTPIVSDVRRRVKMLLEQG
jgi:glyoxylase-like metal-dependent hydrolase (beta-lactamase superfamily II)